MKESYYLPGYFIPYLILFQMPIFPFMGSWFILQHELNIFFLTMIKIFNVFFQSFLGIRIPFKIGNMKDMYKQCSVIFNNKCQAWNVLLHDK